MENRTKIGLAALGCAVLLLGILLAVLAGGWLWLHYRPAGPPVATAAATDTTTVAHDPRAVLQRIAATVPDYTVMDEGQRAACSEVFAQALTAQDAGRLAPAEYDQLIDAWAALLADNVVTAGEVAGLQRLAATVTAN